MFYADRNPLVMISPIGFPHQNSLASVLTTNLTYGLFMRLIEQGIVSNNQIISFITPLVFFASKLPAFPVA